MLSEKIAKVTAKILEKVLKVEANTASCVLVYEPKIPEEIRRFKKCCDEEKK